MPGVKPRIATAVKALLGEERPRNMLLLLFLLALVIHIWTLFHLLQPVDVEITPAQPLMMEVSMLSVTASKPSAAPPTAAPPQEKKPEPKKPEPKPTPRKVTTAPPKPLDLGPVDKHPEQVTSQIASQNTPVTETKAEAVSAPQEFTEASFKASYLHNPKPEYPSVAKIRGWEGKVMLKVKVSAKGTSDSIEVEHSSGHEILDESAIEAVKQWQFVPAKHGETTVSSSVIVPIVFHLSED
jgi:protein TonB